MVGQVDMEETTGILVASAAYEQEVSAEAVHLLVTVHGASLITGRAALTKAKEVARLVEALALVGIDAGAVDLDAVCLESSSGLLGSSSAAIYRLRIRCAELARLPDVLGAITGSKNVRLEQLVWRYPESTELYATWLESAIAAANVKARAMAAALGARIVGVHHISEHALEGGEEKIRRPSFGDGPMRMARAPALELGFELTQRQRIGVRVAVQYRVEGFEPPDPKPRSSGEMA
jgi:hypothetical protein